MAAAASRRDAAVRRPARVRGGPLSREVLGGVEEAGDDRRDAGPRASAPVEDLAAPSRVTEPPAARPPGPRWPDRAPAWVRSPLGAGIVAVAALVLGAVLGTGLAERAELQERRSTVRLLATLAWPQGRPEPGSPVPLWVVVLNAGPEAVTVREAELAGSAAQLRLLEEAEIPPGGSRSLDATLSPDCSPGSPGTLTLGVTGADGRGREVTPGTLGRGLGMAPGDAARLCDDVALEPIPVWRTFVDDGAALSLQVRNTRSEPVQLTASSPPGTSVVADPPLPVTLPTDRSVLVRLRLDVERCTSAAQRPNAGEDLLLLVDEQAAVIRPDAAIVVGWFAQQVADACR